MTPEAIEWSSTWSADELDVTSARHRFVGWLSRTSAEALAEDLALVLTELLTNARNASRASNGRIELWTCVDQRSVTIEVTNTGSTIDTDRLQRATGPPPDARALRGRGLVIVSRLTDSLRVGVVGDGVVVRATRRLA